jgi:hypothetical protein
MAKDVNPSSTPYPANRGNISSAVDNAIVDSLKRSTSNSLPVRHNEHVAIGGGKGSITGPATDGIVSSDFGKGKSYE